MNKSRIGRRVQMGWKFASTARAARRVVAVAGEAVGIDRWGRLVGGLAPALAIGHLAGRSYAGPEGAQVASGNVQITKQGDVTVIRASDRSIINFKSFDIGGHETVQFVQPDALARVLNRINSAAPSKIDGKLLANGRVFIVNPAGVIFGKGAVINASGIFAAAGNISDADFVKGIYRFTDVKGSVVNDGTIQAQNVALIGKYVGNSGSIVADKGAVVMTSADSVMIGENGGHMYVRLDQAGEMGPASNAPASEAPKRNPWAVGDMYSLAIRNAGTVKAGSAHLEAKKGVVAVEGKIDVSSAAPGTTGGSAAVLGQYVAVSGSIDASGPAGGGQILVGGNLQGHGPEANAIRTTITPSGELRADATQAGDGGRVIVWSDDQTNFAGHISAQGSGASGRGGFAEVSGKQNLRFKGTADLGGPAAPGELLLDPAVIVLTGGSGDGAADGTDTFFGDPGAVEGFIAFADTGPTTVFESEIEGLVANAAASITLQATDSITTSGTFTGGLSLGATNLTLQTSNATVAGVIDLSGVSLSSTSGNIQILGSTSGVEASTITLGTITTGTGTITVSNGLGGVTAGGALDTSGGGINLTTLNGALTINAPVTVTGAADIILNSTGSSTVVGAQLTSTAGAITFGNTGSAGADIGANVSGNTGITFTNAVTLTSAATIQSDAGVVNALSTFDAGANNVVFHGDQVEFDGGAGSVIGTGTITIRPTLGTTSISIGDAATGTFDLDTSDTDALGSGFSQITIGSATGSGLTTIGTATFNAPVTIAQGGANGQIALTNTAALSTSNDAITLTAGTGDSGSLTRPDGGQINAGNALITLTADAMDLGSNAGEIQTTGGVILQPASVGRPIVIGAAGSSSDLVLSQAEVDDVISGELFLGIGRANGQHAISVDAVSFGSATTIRTPSGGSITVNGAVSAPDLRLQGAKVFATGSSASATANLFLDGGTSTITGPTVTLDGGTGTLTTGVIDIGTNQLTLSGDEITINGAITGSGASVLLLEPSADGVSIDVGVNSGGTGTLDLSDAELANISGVGSLGIGRATGTHTIVIDDITFPVATTVRTPSGGSIAVDGAVAAPSLRLQGVKSFNSGGSLTASTGTLFLDGGTGTLTADTSFTADEIDLPSTITGAFVLTLQPTTNTTSIGVGGGAGTLDISDSDLSNIAGTSGVIIGRSGGTHAVAIGSSTFADPTTVRGGAISTSAAITGTGDASVTLNGSSISLGGNISTAGQTVALQGPVTLTSSPTINTTVGAAAGAGVTFTGTVNGQAAGAQSLTVTAGTGGAVDFQQAVGGGTSLANLTVDSGSLAAGAVTTTGFVDLTSRNPMSLAGVLTVGGAASFETLKTSGSSISVTNAANTFGSVAARTLSDDGSGVATSGDIQVVESGNTNVTQGDAGGSFNVTSTGNVTFSGPVTAGTDVTSSGVGFTSNSGAFIQATDGSVTINHTGAVVLNDQVDAWLNSSVQSVTINGSTVNINSAVTADDDLTITGTGAVTVGAALTSNTAAVDVTGVGLTVTSGGTATSATTTSFDGGSGGVIVNGAVVAGTGFTSTGAGFTNSDTVTATTGAITLAHTGAVTVGATLDAQAGLVSVTGADVTLSATTAVNAATTAAVNAAGDLDIAGDVTAATSILLHGGTDGTGDLGFTATGVDLSSASITLRAGNGTGVPINAVVDALTNAPQFRGAAGGATSPTTYVHRQDASILNGQIADANQFKAATNVQGVAYTLQSDDGSVNLTDGTKVSGADLTISGAGGFIIASDIDFGNTDITISGPADVQASGVEVSVGTGSLTFGDTLSLNANGLTLTGDEIDFLGGAGSITGTGGLILQPATGSLPIFIGDVETGGRLDLSDTDLAALDTQFSLVTVGRGSGTHAVSINSATLRDPFLFRGATVELLANGGGPALQGTGRGSASMSAGTITLNDDVRTESGPVNFDGNVILSPDTGNSISVVTTDNSTTGADISFNGLTDSDNAGTPRDLVVQGGIGTATFFGQVGTTPLASVTATSESISLANVVTTGSQSYTGGLTLNGNLTSTTAGSITLTGDATLGGDVSMQTNGGSAADDISVTGAVTGAGNDLTANAGAQGGVSFGDTVSGVAALTATGATVATRDLSTSGGNVSLTGVATVNGDVSATNGSILFNSNASLSGDLATTGTGVITLSGTTTLTGTTQSFQTANRNITMGPVTGASALTVNAGSGAVSVGQVGATRLTSLNITGATITTSSTVGTVGSQSYTGATTLGGNLSTTSGPVSVTGQTTLATPVTIAAPGSQINLVGVSGGGNSLALNTGDGAVTLTGDAGSLSSMSATGETIALRAVTTSGSQQYTGDTTLGGSLLSNTAGSISIDGSTTLAAPVSIETAGAASDDVTLDSVDGNGNAFSINAGSGDVTVDAASDLSNFDVLAGTIDLTSVSTTGNQTYTGTTTATGDLEATSGGNILFNNDAELSGDVTSTGGTITVSGTTTLAGASQNFSASGGGVTLAAVNGPANLTINASGGTITAGTVGATPLQSFVAQGQTINMLSTVETTGGQQYNGSTTLAGNLTSAGGNIAFTGDTAVTPATLTISTGGGTVSSTGNITGTGTSLVVNAGSGDVDVSAIVHDLADTGTAGLASTNITGRDITVGRVSTSGAQTYNASRNLNVQGQLRTAGANNLTLTGGSLVTLQDNLRTGGTGSVSVTGPTRVNVGGTINVATGNGNVTFANDINSATDGVGGLVINAGTGAVDLQGNVGTGANGRLSSVTATGSTIGVRSVSTSQAQQYTGATSLNGDLTSGASTTVTGALTLLTDAVISAASGATFTGAVDAQSAGQQGLTVTSSGQAVNFQGAVGSGAELKQLTVTGNTTATSVETSGSQLYSGSLSAASLSSTTGNIGSSGGAFAVTGAVSAAGGGVTVDAGSSNVSIGGATTAQTTNLTGGAISVGTVTTTTGDQSYNGGTTASGALTSAGGITGSGSFTGQGNINATGALALNGGPTGSINLQGDTTAQSATLTGSSISVANVTTTGGAQLFTGATTVLGDLTATGGGITVAGTTTLSTAATHTFLATGQAIDLDAVAGGTNGLVLSGQTVVVGDAADLGSLTVTAPGGITLSSVASSGNQLYTGPLTLGSNLTTSAGSITVAGASTITGPVAINATGGGVSMGAVEGGGNSLTLTASANKVELTGDAANLGSFSATGPAIETRSVSSTGAQSYTGPATVTGSVQTTAGGVTFNNAASVSGNVTTTGGSIVFNDAAALGGSLTTNTTGNISIAGTTTLTGSAMQTIESKQGTISLSSVAAQDSGVQELTLISGKPVTQSDVAARVRIGGSVGASDKRLKTFKIGGGTLAGGETADQVPVISTVVFAPNGSFLGTGAVDVTQIDLANPASFSVNAQDFQMTSGEKITAFGNLSIDASNSATLRDLSSIGALVIKAPTITLAGRARAPQLPGGAGPVQTDIGLDFVAKNGVTFDGSVTLDGGTEVTIGSDQISAVPSVAGAQALQFLNGVTLASFQRAGDDGTFLRSLDLRADGRSSTNVATAIAGATPREADIDPGQSIGITASMRDQLQEFGVYVKNLDPDMQVEFLVGRAIYVDIPGKPNPSARDFEITPNRLAVDRVREVLDAYNNVKAVASRGGDQAEWTDRAQEITASAASACATAKGKDVADLTGAELAEFVMNDPGQAQAKELMLAVVEFLQRIDSLGLSPGESAAPKQTMVDKLAGRDLSIEQVNGMLDAIRAAGRS